MWNRPKPRPKLTIHTTDRHLSDGQRARGSAKYLAVAVAILILVTHYIPTNWWFPEAKDFRPPKAATVPIERAVVEPEPAPVVVAEVVPEPPPKVMLGPENLPAWKRYAVPVVLDPTKAKIAIVIDDMGVNHVKSREMLDLPAGLTLSFLPYAEGVADMAKEARSKGHEIMVHIPMQPLSPDENPGPNALLTTMMPGELQQTIQANLAGLSEYVGINNHMGSMFTQDTLALKELMKILKAQGLFLLDSKTIGSSRAYSEAKLAGVPAVERDVFLDDDPAYASVVKQIAEAEEVARKKGSAIVIGHPKEDTIRALKEFLARADADGIQVVPLSAIVMMSENAAPARLPPPEPEPEPSAPSP